MKLVSSTESRRVVLAAHMVAGMDAPEDHPGHRTRRDRMRAAKQQFDQTVAGASGSAAEEESVIRTPGEQLRR